jgi:hypothetical protein
VVRLLILLLPHLLLLLLLLKPLLHLPLLHLLPLLLLQSNRLDKLDKKADASRLFCFCALLIVT